MSTRLSSFVILSLLALRARDAHASDAYVIRFDAVKHVAPCNDLVWHDTVLFYNRGASPVVVRIIGISGTPGRTSPEAITLPPNRVVNLEEALNGAWHPAPSSDYNLWTTHLDVPANVQVESRDEVYSVNTCIAVSQPFSLGRVSMPVFTHLTEPSSAQVHLGTDVGQRDARTNIAIYNAGAVAAAVSVELRRVCDDSIVDQQVFTIPPNTTLQIGGLKHGTDTCATGSTVPWMRYSVVTVDQPSLSLVPV
jgi:hypothetical protein